MSALPAPAAPLPKLKMQHWWMSNDGQICFHHIPTGRGWLIKSGPQVTSETCEIIRSSNVLKGFTTRREAIEAVSCEMEKANEGSAKIIPLIMQCTGWWVSGGPYFLTLHRMSPKARPEWRFGTLMGTANPEKQAFDAIFTGVFFPTRRAALQALVAWRQVYLDELDSSREPLEHIET